ncbi:hypothetical protein PR048_006479 [Dryococelus australis]|uniref:Uncharacterized protein n=1 Tax=Dryococelus australis TaxID=614101 RepID=A0ABQ9IB72_9NEOP|nr:hypothetical protein PR048_006479 [Dryococelus australis]
MAPNNNNSLIFTAQEDIHAREFFVQLHRHRQLGHRPLFQQHLYVQPHPLNHSDISIAFVKIRFTGSCNARRDEWWSGDVARWRLARLRRRLPNPLRQNHGSDIGLPRRHISRLLLACLSLTTRYTFYQCGHRVIAPVLHTLRNPGAGAEDLRAAAYTHSCPRSRPDEAQCSKSITGYRDSCHPVLGRSRDLGIGYSVRLERRRTFWAGSAQLYKPWRSSEWRVWNLIRPLALVQRLGGNTASLARRNDEALGVRVSVARIAPSLLDLGRGVTTGWRGDIWATLYIENLSEIEVRWVWSSSGMKGREKRRSPRKPVDQRHRPARFPREKIREQAPPIIEPGYKLKRKINTKRAFQKFSIIREHPAMMVALYRVTTPPADLGGPLDYHLSGLEVRRRATVFTAGDSFVGNALRPPPLNTTRNNPALRERPSFQPQRAGGLHITCRPVEPYKCGESCRAMPLVGEFSRDLLFLQSLHSGAAPYSLYFTLIGSQDLDVKSRPNFFTPLQSPTRRNYFCQPAPYTLLDTELLHPLRCHTFTIKSRPPRAQCKWLKRGRKNVRATRVGSTHCLKDRKTLLERQKISMPRRRARGEYQHPGSPERGRVVALQNESGWSGRRTTIHIGLAVTIETRCVQSSSSVQAAKAWLRQRSVPSASANTPVREVAECVWSIVVREVVMSIQGDCTGRGFLASHSSVTAETLHTLRVGAMRHRRACLCHPYRSLLTLEVQLHSPLKAVKYHNVR